MDNKEIVKSFFGLMHQGEFEKAFNNYAATDLEWIVAMANSPDLTAAIPWDGVVHKGFVGFKKLNESLFGEFEGLAFQLEDSFAEGDTVVGFGHLRFKHKETQKVAESDFAIRITMRDGRIARGQFFENTFAIANARKRVEGTAYKQLIARTGCYGGLIGQVIAANQGGVPAC